MKLFTCFLLLASLTCIPAITIMSIDLGAEWMKMAVVAPGVPMEIALNKESKRKTPFAVSFRDGIRTFGEDAMTAGTRSPQTTYVYLLDLLGKQVSNPVVELYKSRFPYYNIEEDPKRKILVFRVDEETTYSVEELVAQILNHALELASAHTNQRIKDAVITVPPFFGQVERRALLRAASLAGLKVLSLMNSNSAVALNYGMFRRKEINETAQNILFYDMGASFTTATIVSYQTMKTKEHGYTETNPQVTILGLGFDRNLGGLEMQIRLRNFLASHFDSMKKTKNSVFDSHRGMAKLFKEAGRLKSVLSANAEHISQVENVIDDVDLKLTVTRQDFESLCEDLFERVRDPVDAALISAGLDISTISQFIIVGGNTRIPRIQNILSEVWGKELGKNINADEAAAMGAVYRAADLGQGFKVKKFHVKESVIYPIDVDFERVIENDDGSKTTKMVKRSLFAVGSNYPQKKVMTFNKHTSDFVFSINYGDLGHLNSRQAKALGVRNVSVVMVNGVTDVFATNMKDDVESKGIKAHFSKDDSGLLHLTSVEAVFEKNVTEEVPPPQESTFSKIGNTISKLFTGSDSGENGNNTESEKKEGEEINKTGTEKKKEKAEKSNAKNGETKESEKEKEVKTKIVTLKEDLNFTITFLDLPEPTKEALAASRNKLDAVTKAEKERIDMEAARNSLESYILDVQDKLSQELYQDASKEDQREDIIKMCSEIDEWIYGDGFNQPAEEYKKHLRELEALFEPIKERVYEHEHRPEAIKALQDMINMSSMFLYKGLEARDGENWFTDVELKSLDELIIETQKWLEGKEEDQEKMKLYELPVLTLASVGEKIGVLDREIKYLVNKAKLAKIKKEKEDLEARLKAEKEAKEADKVNKTLQAEENKMQDKNKTTEEPPLSEKGEEEEEGEAGKSFVEPSEENDTEASRRKDDAVEGGAEDQEMEGGTAESTASSPSEGQTEKSETVTHGEL